MRSFAQLLAPVLVILALALPAPAQGPRLVSGPASLLSSDPVFGAASGAQRIGTVVPTPEGWLVLWTDSAMRNWETVSRSLVATRLAPDGTVRDTTGIRVARDVSSRYTAVASPDGARIYWARPGTTGFALRTASVSDDGALSETRVIGEYPDDAVSTTLAAAATGSRTAVLLDRYVMILDGTRLLRTVDLGGRGDFASIVAAGSHFVVAWVASGNILMRQTLDLDGNPVGPPGGTGVANPTQLHALASDGSSAMLAWSDAAGIHVSIIDPANGTLTEKSTIGEPWVQPAVVWNGSSYFVAWATYGSGAVRGMRVSAGGAPLDVAARQLYDGVPTYFTLGARGSDTLMLFEGGGCIRYSCETDVFAMLVGTEPSSSGNLVSAAARTQSEPAIASDGSGFLALWREGSQLFVAETDARSRAQSTPVMVADAYGSGTSVSSTGNGYLAAWVALRNGSYVVEGASVTGHGTPTARQLFSIDLGKEGPNFVATGASREMYLVVWRAGDKLQATRVRGDGTLLDTAPFPLVSDQLPWAPPAVAFDGRDFVVGWLSSTGGTDPKYQVLTQRVSPDGIARFDRSWQTARLGAIQDVALDCGDASCLIAWNERIDYDGYQNQLYGMRFRTGGEPIDATPFTIDFAEVAQSGPSVSWDGSRFVATWRKYVGDTGPERIEGRLVPPDGEVVRVAPDLLAERDIYMSAPVVDCNRAGVCAIVGPDTVDDDVLGRATRLFKRFFGETRRRGIRP